MIGSKLYLLEGKSYFHQNTRYDNRQVNENAIAKKQRRHSANAWYANATNNTTCIESMANKYTKHEHSERQRRVLTVKDTSEFLKC